MQSPRWHESKARRAGLQYPCFRASPVPVPVPLCLCLCLCVVLFCVCLLVLCAVCVVFVVCFVSTALTSVVVSPPPLPTPLPSLPFVAVQTHDRRYGCLLRIGGNSPQAAGSDEAHVVGVDVHHNVLFLEHPLQLTHRAGTAVHALHPPAEARRAFFAKDTVRWVRDVLVNELVDAAAAGGEVWLELRRRQAAFSQRPLPRHIALATPVMDVVSVGHGGHGGGGGGVAPAAGVASSLSLTSPRRPLAVVPATGQLVVALQQRQRRTRRAAAPAAAAPPTACLVSTTASVSMLDVAAAFDALDTGATGTVSIATLEALLRQGGGAGAGVIAHQPAGANDNIDTVSSSLSSPVHANPNPTPTPSPTPLPPLSPRAAPYVTAAAALLCSPWPLGGCASVQTPTFHARLTAVVEAFKGAHNRVKLTRTQLCALFQPLHPLHVVMPSLAGLRAAGLVPEGASDVAEWARQWRSAGDLAPDLAPEELEDVALAFAAADTDSVGVLTPGQAHTACACLDGEALDADVLCRFAWRLLHGAPAAGGGGGGGGVLSAAVAAGAAPARWSASSHTHRALLRVPPEEPSMWVGTRAATVGVDTAADDQEATPGLDARPIPPPPQHHGRGGAASLLPTPSTFTHQQVAGLFITFEDFVRFRVERDLERQQRQQRRSGGGGTVDDPSASSAGGGDADADAAAPSRGASRVRRAVLPQAGCGRAMVLLRRIAPVAASLLAPGGGGGGGGGGNGEDGVDGSDMNAAWLQSLASAGRGRGNEGGVGSNGGVLDTSPSQSTRRALAVALLQRIRRGAAHAAAVPAFQWCTTTGPALARAIKASPDARPLSRFPVCAAAAAAAIRAVQRRGEAVESVLNSVRDILWGWCAVFRWLSLGVCVGGCVCVGCVVAGVVGLLSCGRRALHTRAGFGGLHDLCCGCGCGGVRHTSRD